jgi:uncharacterized protein (TIGR00297 family)
MIDTARLITGILLAAGIAFSARKVHALNTSGMWTAGILGVIIMGFGGLRWAIVLMGFFISSSLLSRLFKRRKASLDEKYAKGDERDAGQVLANGGIAALFVLLQFVLPENRIPWLGFAASLAAANADTWATELGALSPVRPRLITTLRAVDRGTSGGITITGTLAALAGSAFIGLLAWVFTPPALAGQFPPMQGFALVTLAGLAGSLVDSLLGASIQSIYFCPACKKETERHPTHTCGGSTVPLRGARWLNNDWVNTLCTLSSGVFTVLALMFLLPV